MSHVKLYFTTVQMYQTAILKEEAHTVKNVRRFYGKIPSIWLPVHLPLLLRGLPVEHLWESRYGSVTLTDSTQKTCSVEGLHDESKGCPILPCCLCCSCKCLRAPVK